MYRQTDSPRAYRPSPGTRSGIALFVAGWVLCFLAVVPARAATAEPMVVVDVPAVHSLVAQVMGERGELHLLLRRESSAHDYALRPSDAGVLQQATLVFWISDQLTPWLARALHNLADDATAIELADVEGTVRYPMRAADQRPASGDSAQEHGHGHDHSPGALDPHLWLDPQNASTWLDAIARALSDQDPAHEAVYRSNAQRAMDAVRQLDLDLATRLAPISDMPSMVYHDSYQYFERRYSLTVAAALSPGDASDPGPARLLKLRALLADGNVRCLFSDRQFNPRLVETVAAGSAINVAALDPTGTMLDPGPELYNTMMLELADTMVMCLQ